MEDQHLERLLRELPREQARQGFTPRVLARLNAAPPARAGWRPRLAAGLTALLLIAGGVVRHEQREAERSAQVARAEQVLRELRAEHRQIKRELEALPEAPPVIYLGGNEDMDLVVDLRQVQKGDGARPATYRYDTF
jgi:hypothetical protein